MITDELKKEAEEWIAEYTGIDVETQRAIRLQYHDNLRNAYIAGAEPREKQIAELEAQIEKMKWHKIADGDIPKVTGDYITNIGVLTYDHYGNNIYKWHTPFCEACGYGDEVDDDEVIAWCEIPKYTKEIKEK